jgi:hypothetical protein
VGCGHSWHSRVRGKTLSRNGKTAKVKTAKRSQKAKRKSRPLPYPECREFGSKFCVVELGVAESDEGKRLAPEISPPEPGTSASRSLRINGKTKNGKTEFKCKRQSIPLCRFNVCRFAVL